MKKNVKNRQPKRLQRNSRNGAKRKFLFARESDAAVAAASAAFALILRAASSGRLTNGPRGI